MKYQKPSSRRQKLENNLFKIFHLRENAKGFFLHYQNSSVLGSSIKSILGIFGAKMQCINSLKDKLMLLISQSILICVKFYWNKWELITEHVTEHG